MRAIVRDSFHAFSEDLEGVVPFLYLDIRGLVTTAMGVLIEPRSAVDWLPLVRPDGTRATVAEKRADWDRVHARQDLAPRGGMIFRTVAQLRLTPDGLQAVTDARLADTVRHLRNIYAEWDAWPSDAQLGTLSMAWAAGPFFGHAGWPRLHAALLACDWHTAALESRIRGGGTIPRRNDRTRLCYLNAERVKCWALPVEPLHWPADVPPPSVPVEIVDDEDTQPDRPVGPGSPGYEATSDAVHDAARRHLERERE